MKYLYYNDKDRGVWGKELDDYVTTYSPTERETTDHIKTAEVKLNQTNQNNTYYGKNNNIVTKEVYEKECTKTIVKRVVIPNTGAERNYAGIAVGISMILGSVYLFFRQKNIFNK